MNLSLYTPLAIEIIDPAHYNYFFRDNHVYVAGKISGLDDWEEKFLIAENFIKKHYAFPISPRILPPKMTQEAYMDICFSLVRNCTMILFLKNWKDSLGAVAEHAYAIKIARTVLYEE
jgi:Domain of unknown function (DUF4406)